MRKNSGSADSKRGTEFVKKWILPEDDASVVPISLVCPSTKGPRIIYRDLSLQKIGCVDFK